MRAESDRSSGMGDQLTSLSLPKWTSEHLLMGRCAPDLPKLEVPAPSTV